MLLLGGGFTATVDGHIVTLSDKTKKKEKAINRTIRENTQRIWSHTNCVPNSVDKKPAPANTSA
jgi:hypothetical protein